MKNLNLTEHVGGHINEKKVLCTVCGKYVLARWKREHQLRHVSCFVQELNCYFSNTWEDVTSSQ